jgi:hypothetical protein
MVYNSNYPFCRFEKAKKKIAAKYDEIERSLIEEFVKAHRSDDKGRMKEIATILSHFKGYPQCIDAFIEQSQMVRRFSDIFFFITIKPLFNESQGIGFSYTKSRFSQNGWLCKITSKTIFFTHILTVLYDFYFLVVLKYKIQ